MSRNNSRILCLYATRSYMLFVIGVDDDSRTAIKAVSEGLPHSGKCDFLNIVETNIPLIFKENIFIYFYYFNCWFTG